LFCIGYHLLELAAVPYSELHELPDTKLQHLSHTYCTNLAVATRTELTKHIRAKQSNNVFLNPHTCDPQPQQAIRSRPPKGIVIGFLLSIPQLRLNAGLELRFFPPPPLLAFVFRRFKQEWEGKGKREGN
jgi:hypothetical protein